MPFTHPHRELCIPELQTDMHCSAVLWVIDSKFSAANLESVLMGAGGSSAQGGSICGSHVVTWFPLVGLLDILACGCKKHLQ
jgi:hypothetical protein